MNIVRSFGIQPITTSADFSQFVVTTASAACETSPGKTDNLPLMSLLHLLYGVWAVLDFTMFG